MSRTLRIVIPVLVLFVGAAGMVVLARQREIQTRPAPERTAPLVETLGLQPHTSGLDIEVDGLVVPYRELSLAAEVAGRVTFKAEECRGGNYVTQGTLLMEIDPRDYQFQVKQLQEELQQAESNLAELEAESRNLKEMIEVAEETQRLQAAELQRQQKLARRRVATATQLDESRRAYLKARSELLQLRKQLQMLDSRRSRLQAAQQLTQLRLEKARLDVQRTRVTAPVDGVVIQDMVEADSYVSKGTQLLTFEDTSKVEVKCHLKMDELYWLWLQAQSSEKRAGQAAPLKDLSSVARRDYQLPRTPARVVYELAGRRFAWQGVLSRYEGIGLDEATRTVPARAIVARPRQVRVLDAHGESLGRAAGPPALVRGMYVTVRLHAEPNIPLYTVPERAVRPGDRLWLVEDDKLRKVRVRVIEVIEGDAIVRPRLDDAAAARLLRGGARAVTSPLAAAEEGMDVRVEGE